MTDQSTALAPTSELGRVPSDEEIEQVRQAGRQQVAYRKEVNEIFKTIAGLEWGTGRTAVRGSSFSPETRWALAQFCYLTGANPYYHVDILGGGPYLNAEFWSDRINSDPLFHHYEQRDLSPSAEQALRDRAARLNDVAMQLPEGEERAKRLLQAIDLEEEADDIAMARSSWSAPEWAQVVVQTTIYRFMNAAPIDAIRAGDVPDFGRYLIAVPECNWAGGRPPAKRKDGSGTYDADPIGNEEPAKTARTRSLRRAAARALPVMRTLESQIRKAEKVFEGGWEIVQEDQRAARAALPSPNGEQAARTGSGEPGAANPAGAQPIPVGVDPEAAQKGAEESARAIRDIAAAADPAWDETDARKTFFGSLKDAGISEDDRRAWAVGHGLPSSTKEWGQEGYARAMEILCGPERREPAMLRDWQQLAAHVNGLADEDEGGEQRSLV